MSLFKETREERIRMQEAELLYKDIHRTVEQAAKYLGEDEVLVLPCDTIYGFSARYGTAEAKLRKLKNQNPFPVLATLEQAKELCVVPPELEDHWPCPLTAILPNKNGKGTTAIRVPNDHFIQTLLRRLGSPIYSTTVDERGYTAITNITDIIFAFKHSVKAIVIDPERTGDTPSTLIDCTTKPFTLLRCGIYNATELLIQS